MTGSRWRRVAATIFTPVLVALGVAAGGQPAAATEPARAAVTQPVPAHDLSRPARGYAALGDSFSSGEGTKVYYAGTDVHADRCHRSPSAYGPLLRRSDHRLRPFTFVACSGATTHELYAANAAFPSEGPQLDALTRRARAVSVTIGGNDLGFADVVAACLQVGPSSGFGCSGDVRLKTRVGARMRALAGHGAALDPHGHTITPVATVLKDIARRSPRATVYLAGYPELFGDRAKHFSDDPTAPSSRSCVVNATLGARIDLADVRWFNANTRKLNAVLRGAVKQARRKGVRARYVPVHTFDGHGLCDAKTAWIRPLLISHALIPRSESFHPTSVGQRRGYLRAFHRAGL